MSRRTKWILFAGVRVQIVDGWIVAARSGRLVWQAAS